jgi:hypothetical protein
MEYPSLSHLINVILKSTLSKISIATPACFGGHWLGTSSSRFHPQPVLVSVMRWVSFRQLIIESSFLIQFGKWCLLMWELSPLTFSVSIDGYVVILVI